MSDTDSSVGKVTSTNSDCSTGCDRSCSVTMSMGSEISDSRYSIENSLSVVDVFLSVRSLTKLFTSVQLKVFSK